MKKFQMFLGILVFLCALCGCSSGDSSSLSDWGNTQWIGSSDNVTGKAFTFNADASQLLDASGFPLYIQEGERFHLVKGFTSASKYSLYTDIIVDIHISDKNMTIKETEKETQSTTEYSFILNTAD